MQAFEVEMDSTGRNRFEKIGNRSEARVMQTNTGKQ